jgi:acetoin:2,6-dichlorophenolindophenol oxidoreductase subunit alpha
MASDLSPAVDDAARVDLFRTMVLIRAFEDAILREHNLGAAPGPGDLRLSAGREPVAAGVCAHLDNSDALTAAHRPHHLAIAHGMDLLKLARESLGFENPQGEGRRNRWHLFDPETHFVSSATIAEGYPPALGRAFAFQQRGNGRVAVAVTDRTAAHQEGFREALNLAALWTLPLVFVVEDDEWETEPPRSAAHSVITATDLSAEYGVPTERVEDNAVESVYEAAAKAVGRARIGQGPSVIEVHTVRLWNQPEAEPPSYRTGLYDTAGRDPVPTYEQALRKRGLLTDLAVAQIRDEAVRRVENAIRVALGRTEDSGDDDVEGNIVAWERRAAR